MKREFYPFYSIMSYIQEMYDIELKEDFFETAAMSAWKKIGNKDTRMYISIQRLENNETESYTFIPCNCLQIESITINREDAPNTSNKGDYFFNEKRAIEDITEGNKYVGNSLYQSGELVEYRQVGDMLYFKQDYGSVNILYHGIYADESGLPYINEKEMDAIASFCVYSYFYKKTMSTLNPDMLQLSGMQKQDWMIKCTQARIPDYFSQNELDSILNAKTSWDRKVYGITYKPVE